MVTDKDLIDAGLENDGEPETQVITNNSDPVIIGSGIKKSGGATIVGNGKSREPKKGENERTEEEEEIAELTDRHFRRIFPCQVSWKGVRLWTLYFTAWFVGLVLLSAIFFLIGFFVLSTYIDPLVPVFFLDILYITAFAVDMYVNRLEPVRAGERVVTDMWGELSDKVSSGLAFKLPGEIFHPVPTGIRQIEFGVLAVDKDGLPVAGTGSIGILTNESDEGEEALDQQVKNGQAKPKGKKQDDGAVLGWLLTLNFRYPIFNEDLKAFFKNAPLPDDPRDFEELEAKIGNLIDEPMKDIVRSVDQIEGHPWSYKKIMRERVKFDQGINKLFGEHEKIIQFVGMLRLRNMTPAGKHTELPAVLKTALNDKVAARPKGEAIKIETIIKGEGDAQVLYLLRKRIIDLWNEPTSNKGDRNIAYELEQFKTYVESMKDGSKFAVAPNIISGFGQMIGGPSPEKTLGMKKEELESYISIILKKLIDEHFSQGQEPK